MQTLRRLKQAVFNRLPRVAAPPAAFDDREVDLRGIGYLEALKALHAALTPQSYAEIGTALGNSLAVAACRSLAIDVDFSLAMEVMGRKPELRLLQTTSSEAFASGAVRAMFPAGVDFAFIDGMHLIEAVLDDFIAMEAHAHAGSVIAVHDVVPVHRRIGERVHQHPEVAGSLTDGWWAGDVWKLRPILAAHRPGLDLTVLDCPPTGILLIRNLDPNDRTLSERRGAILKEWLNVTLAAYSLDRVVAEARIVPGADEAAIARWAGRVGGPQTPAELSHA